MQEDSSSPQPPIEEIKIEQPKPKKEDKTYALRFVLQLIFGNIFVGCLIGTIVVVILSIVQETFNPGTGSGEVFAGLITSVIIFGILNILLTLSTKKSPDEKPKTWQNVLSIIYCSGWALAGIWFLWLIVSGPIGLALGLSDAEGIDVLQNTLIGVSALIIIAIVIIEQMRLIPKLPRLFYTIIMSIITIVTLTLFLIFPAATTRNAAYDDKVESDLNQIYNAINDYASDNYALPKNLNEINEYLDDDFNFKLSDYEYTPSSEGYDEYELCAVFKTGTIRNDEDDEKYMSYGSSFYRHKKGRYCFSRSSYYAYPYKGLHPIYTNDADEDVEEIEETDEE